MKKTVDCKSKANDLNEINSGNKNYLITYNHTEKSAVEVGREF